MRPRSCRFAPMGERCSPTSPSFWVRPRAGGRSRGLPRRADHRDPELLLGHRGRVLADDPPLEDDEDSVGKGQDLLELERDQKDRASLVTLLDEPPVHELDRADVEAACRLGCDEDPGVAFYLAREHDLLLVATAERGRTCRGSSSAHVVPPEQVTRALDHASRAEPAPARDRRLVIVVQRDVLGERELQHQATALTVFWNVTEPRLEVVVRVFGRDLFVADQHTPAGTSAQTRDRIDQLALSVPVDARDAHDLAGSDP